MLKQLNSYGSYTIGRIWYYIDNYCGEEIRKQLTPELLLNGKQFAKVQWVVSIYSINDKEAFVVIPKFNFTDKKYNEIQEKMIDSVTIHLTEFEDYWNEEEITEAIEKYDECKNIKINSIECGSSIHEK